MSIEEQEAKRIWDTLMPNWKGAVMLFRTSLGEVAIQGGDIFNVILKAVTERATQPPPLGINVGESVKSQDRFGR